MSETWLLDSNVLVALTLNSHVHHRAAHQALRQHDGNWATSPITEASLLRLLINPAVTGLTITSSEAQKALAGLRAHRAWTFLSDESSLAQPLIDLTVMNSHRQVTDLHLLNLAVTHGALLATFDSRITPRLVPDDRHHVRLLSL
jgi:uncharacterized protein